MPAPPGLFGAIASRIARTAPDQPGRQREPASFRDPTGFVYRRDGVLYRQLSHSAAEDWQHFLASGLYERLVERGWLVEHAEVATELAFDGQAWRVLRPREIEFVSYPYEWTFGQLKDAALLTLDVQAQAMAAGMALKDASAYNVVFDGGRPVLIDALSFERRAPDAPWMAYRQFCQHFLAPLALMALRDVRCGLFLRDFIDGIPLDLASRLLPASTRLRMGLGLHIHLHARAQRRADGASPDGNAANQGGASAGRGPRMSTTRMEALVDSLRRSVESLNWQPRRAGWTAYGELTSYSSRAAASKRTLVQRFVRATSGERVWDLGANTGAFSYLAAEEGRRVVALDADHGAVELLYRQVRDKPGTAILPLVIDLANPSPAIGWAHRERRSLVERANADVVIALALVHHLAIGNNVPLGHLSSFLAQLGRQLILEFVPKSDPRVKAMLSSRRDVFADYSLAGVRAAFDAEWVLAEEEPIEDSERVLLRFSRRKL